MKIDQTTSINSKLLECRREDKRETGRDPSLRLINNQGIVQYYRACE